MMTPQVFNADGATKSSDNKMQMSLMPLTGEHMLDGGSKENSTTQTHPEKTGSQNSGENMNSTTTNGYLVMWEIVQALHRKKHRELSSKLFYYG